MCAVLISISFGKLSPPILDCLNIDFALISEACNDW